MADNKKTPNYLQLYKVTAFALIESDGYTSKAIGYYKDETLAQARVTSGHYSVEERILYCDGNELYDIKPLGKFTDVEEKEKAKITSTIKSKLSKGEVEYIKKFGLE